MLVNNVSPERMPTQRVRMCVPRAQLVTLPPTFMAIPNATFVPKENEILGQELTATVVGMALTASVRAMPTVQAAPRVHIKMLGLKIRVRTVPLARTLTKLQRDIVLLANLGATDLQQDCLIARIVPQDNILYRSVFFCGAALSRICLLTFNLTLLL